MVVVVFSDFNVVVVDMVVINDESFLLFSFSFSHGVHLDNVARFLYTFETIDFKYPQSFTR